ncbi:MAG: lipid II:glycine glycyltransferase FemX [Candidatus Helarchaeota archaeon]
MKFLQLTDDLSSKWDQIVYNSDDAWLFHLSDWLKLTEQIWGFKSKSFLVEHNGEFIAIFPLQIDKNNRMLKSIFMGTGGASVQNGLAPTFRKKILKKMYKKAEQIAEKHNISTIEIYIPPLSKHSLRNRWGVNPLIHYFYLDVSTHTWITDLSPSEDKIYANLTKDARRSINFAKNAGYRIEELKTLDEIDDYYEVHCETYKRTGVKPHPKTYFEGIFKKICKNGFATIWKALTPDGEPVAFETIALFKEASLYWTSCCKTAYLKSGINYLLQFNSMQWAKKQGALWFENGEAFPNVRNGKLKGLTLFKRKFGGELHRFFKGKLKRYGARDHNKLLQTIKDTFQKLLTRITHK